MANDRVSIIIREFFGGIGGSDGKKTQIQPFALRLEDIEMAVALFRLKNLRKNKANGFCSSADDSFASSKQSPNARFNLIGEVVDWFLKTVVEEPAFKRHFLAKSVTGCLYIIAQDIDRMNDSVEGIS